MEEIMLKIDNVSKQYKLGQIGGTTLRDELQRRVAQWRKKEDPTHVIGSKTYNRGEILRALDGVSFQVQTGERVGIIGHNGAGKSTLLKLISRVTAPTDGTISMNGRVASMLEVGTGFHPELTGRENIYMNGSILGMTKKEIDSKIEDIIDFSECRQFIDTPVKRYSSGMYVKLAFSVAAHLDSEIVIMDEVLAVGDMAFQNKCLNKMKDLSMQENRTILYVSHNMNTIRQLCNRCIVLNHGKVIFDGNVDEAISAYSGSVFDNRLTKDYCLENESDKMQKLKRVEIVNTDDPIYEQDDKLQFRLHWYSPKKSDNIVLRAITHLVDGSNVGMQFLNASLNFEEASENCIEVSMDLSCLVPGRYICDLYLTDFSKGEIENLEVFGTALCFEVSRMSKGNGIQWYRSAWGNVALPNMELGTHSSEKG